MFLFFCPLEVAMPSCAEHWDVFWGKLVTVTDVLTYLQYCHHTIKPLLSFVYLCIKWSLPSRWRQRFWLLKDTEEGNHNIRDTGKDCVDKNRWVWKFYHIVTKHDIKIFGIKCCCCFSCDFGQVGLELTKIQLLPV